MRALVAAFIVRLPEASAVVVVELALYEAVALAVSGHRRKLDHDECAAGSSEWHYVSPGVRPSLQARRR